MKEYTIRMVLGHCHEISHDRLEQFIKYHNANPSIFPRFKRIAHEMLEAGQKVSSKFIFEIIRYKQIKEIGQDGFNVNNNYTSIYPRLLEAVDPSFIGFFRYRGIKSQINTSVYDRDNDTVHTVVLD